MKRFDETFKQQVVDAFSSYNADHLADAGWNAFVSKQAKPNRFAFVLPLWAKAASIVLLLTVGGAITFKLTQHTIEKQFTNKIVLPVQKEVSKESNPSLTEQKPDSKENAPSVVNNKTRKIQNPIKPTSDDTDKYITNVVTISVDTSSLAQNIQVDVMNHSDEKIILPASNDSIPAITSPVINQSNYQPLNLIVPPIEPKKGKRFSLTAGLAGMIAKVEDLVSSSPGVSLGLYAEQRITDNISIRPGIAIAKHTYALNDIPSGNRDMFYDVTAPALDGMMSNVESFDTYMDFMAMEIPINILYTLSERRNRSFFVSLGSSSLVYLNQQYAGYLSSVYTREVYDSNTGSTYKESNYTTYKVESEYEAFSRVDLFGLVNLSAGYSFPFSKYSTMTVEPFVQLPVNKITSNNMRLGFGGISLKMRLN